MSIQVTPNEGGKTPIDDSLTVDALAAILAGEEVQEQETEEPEEESEESTETEEAEESEETEEEETEDEPEETEEADLDNLTDEQLEAYRIKFKSKLAADVAKLRQKNREKDALIAQLQSSQPQATPVEEVTSRFLEGIDTTEALSAKVSELKKLGKETARLLLDHEDYGANDLIEVGGGKTYTKKQLRALDLEIKETLIEAVPSKQEQFRKLAFIETQAAEVQTRLKVEVKELSDEESPVAKNFKELIESELFQKITKQFPEAKAVLPYLAGHALKSIHGKQKPAIVTTPGKTPKAKPPGNPAGVGASPAKQANNGEPGKLRDRASQSGTREDLEKYLESIL
jgi:hypothetical protein